MVQKIGIKRFEQAKDLPLPKYATEKSAGVDLLAAVDQNEIIDPGEIKLIGTGIAVQLPDNFEAQVRPRSGLALKHGITVLNSPGTIDADYRGEIKVIIINHGREKFVVERGMRIAQLVFSHYKFIEFSEVKDFASTQRGAKGFGSTGL